MTAYLASAYTIVNIPELWAREIAKVIAATGAQHIIDLGSGSAGPIPLVAAELQRLGHPVTITLSEEAALWARRKAAEENTSVSRLVGKMIEDQMRLGTEYWQAYERWKSLPPAQGSNAKNRLSREEAHERR